MRKVRYMLVASIVSRYTGNHWGKRFRTSCYPLFVAFRYSHESGVLKLVLILLRPAIEVFFTTQGRIRNAFVPDWVVCNNERQLLSL